MGALRIFVGFDGGGSTSKFLVQRKSLEPELFSYSLNLKYSDLGLDESARGFSKCLKEILGADISQLNAICISLSGASDSKKNEEFAQSLRKELNLPQFMRQVPSTISKRRARGRGLRDGQRWDAGTSRPT